MCSLFTLLFVLLIPSFPAIALFVSFLINVFVVAVFAAAFSGSEYSEASIRNAVSTVYALTSVQFREGLVESLSVSCQK